jgi:hypothetical protein
VRAWLASHPRWTFHFTPTSASWLNAVEGFFAKLVDDAIIAAAVDRSRPLELPPRRGVDELPVAYELLQGTARSRSIVDGLRHSQTPFGARRFEPTTIRGSTHPADWQSGPLSNPTLALRGHQ